MRARPSLLLLGLILTSCRVSIDDSPGRSCSRDSDCTSDRRCVLDRCLPQSCAAEGDDVAIDVDPAVDAGVSRLELGVSHGHYSLDPWGDAPSVQRGRALLASLTSHASQAIYGFGTSDPQLLDGGLDLEGSTLDERVELMNATASHRVLTLYGAPDWMTRDATATCAPECYGYNPPLPEHLDDFGALAVRLARRYPGVQHFQVWTAFHNLYDDLNHRYDVQSYNQMYNAVFERLKAADAGLEVGGPWLPLAYAGPGNELAPMSAASVAALRAFLQGAHGVDFVSVSFSADDALGPAPRPADLLALTPIYEGFTQQVRALVKSELGRDVPVWWADDSLGAVPGEQAQAAELTSIVAHQLRGGASVSFILAPQVEADGGPQLSLFSDTRGSDGGWPTPSASGLQQLAWALPPGTALIGSRSTSPEVEAFASAARTLLINKRDRAVNVHLNCQTVALAPYGVERVDTPPRPFNRRSP